MSRSEGSGPAEQAAADVARLLAGATGLHRVVELASAVAGEGARNGELSGFGQATKGATPDTAA